MSSNPSPAHSEISFKNNWFGFGFWLALFVVNFAGILPLYHCAFPFPDINESIYHARELLAGRVPYKQIFTHHFIGYLAPFVLLAHVVDLTPQVVWALGALFNFVSAIFVFLILREIATPSSAKLGALFVVSLGWFPGWTGYFFNIQSILLPFLYLVLLLLVKASSRQSTTFLLGAAFTLGFLFCSDQRLILFLPLLLTPFVSGSISVSLLTLAKLCFFFLVPPLAALAYLWQHDAIADLVNQTLLFPLNYRNHGIGVTNFQSAMLLLDGFFKEDIVCIASLIALILMLRGETRAHFRLLVLGSILAALGYVVIGGRFFHNYLLLFAPAVTLLVSLIPFYLQAYSARAKGTAIILVSIACILSIINPIRRYSITGSVFMQPGDTTARKLADSIIKHSMPADEVLVWGYMAQLYNFSGRRTSFRDFSLFSITGANHWLQKEEVQGIVPEMVAEFKEYLTSTPPKLIVVYHRPLQQKKGVWSLDTQQSCEPAGLAQINNDFERLSHLRYFRDYLKTNYELIDRVSGELDQGDVYLLREK